MLVETHYPRTSPRIPRQSRSNRFSPGPLSLLNSMSRDWHELNSPEQIQPFMERFGNFHDGCIREFHVGTSHYVTGDLRMHFDAPSEARVLVQRQFHVPSAVELRFAEVVGLRWSPPRPNYDAIIFSATL